MSELYLLGLGSERKDPRSDVICAVKPKSRSTRYSEKQSILRIIFRLSSHQNDLVSRLPNNSQKWYETSATDLSCSVEREEALGEQRSLLRSRKEPTQTDMGYMQGFISFRRSSSIFIRMSKSESWKASNDTNNNPELIRERKCVSQWIEVQVGPQEAPTIIASAQERDKERVSHASRHDKGLEVFAQNGTPISAGHRCSSRSEYERQRVSLFLERCNNI